jgi:hypothetical protein
MLYVLRPSCYIAAKGYGLMFLFQDVMTRVLFVCGVMINCLADFWAGSFAASVHMVCNDIQESFYLLSWYFMLLCQICAKKGE